jgi:hypothetical protein
MGLGAVRRGHAGALPVTPCKLEYLKKLRAAANKVKRWQECGRQAEPTDASTPRASARPPIRGANQIRLVDFDNLKLWEDGGSFRKSLYDAAETDLPSEPYAITSSLRATGSISLSWWYRRSSQWPS